MSKTLDLKTVKEKAESIHTLLEDLSLRHQQLVLDYVGHSLRLEEQLWWSNNPPVALETIKEPLIK